MKLPKVTQLDKKRTQGSNPPSLDCLTLETRLLTTTVLPLKKGGYWDFLAVHWVRPCPSTGGAWVQSLLRELRSHAMWHSQKKGGLLITTIYWARELCWKLYIHLLTSSLWDWNYYIHFICGKTETEGSWGLNPNRSQSTPSDLGHFRSLWSHPPEHSPSQESRAPEVNKQGGLPADLVPRQTSPTPSGKNKGCNSGPWLKSWETHWVT